MRRITAISCALALCVAVLPAVAGECSNPNALGTSRTLVIDTEAHPRLGAMQYLETLPLAPREVVLTFDDGPLPPYTNRILDILASECVKATYFLVGRMAQHAPELVRRIHSEGHTVGTHSLNHPLTFDMMALATAQREIDGGVAAVGAALGDPAMLAPFFRIPGLLRARPVEGYLASRSLVTWSADFVADDWHKHITAKEVAQRALQRIEARGRGILLLHDIQPATVLALPTLLKELKARGYRIVQVVPAGPGRPQTYSAPQQWASSGGKRGWLRTAAADSTGNVNPRVAIPLQQSFAIDYVVGPKAIAALTPRADEPPVAAAENVLLSTAAWPEEDLRIAVAEIAPLAPGAESVDWPAALRVAELVPAQAAAWPAARAEHHLQTAAPSRRRPARPAAATSACRNFDLVAAGLAPRCKKPTGHQLSLTPRGPAG